MDYYYDLPMNEPHFTQKQLAQVSKLSDSEIKRAKE